MVLALLSGVGGAQEPEGEGGIIYGSGFAFVAAAPSGWAWQCTPEDPEGMAALYYLAGSSWQESPSVMYITVNSKVGNEAKDLRQFVAGELAHFRKQNPKLVAKTEKPIPTGSGKAAEVWRLSGDQWGNRELVGYVEEESAFMIFVLSSRNEAAFKSSEGAYRQLLESYRFLTATVELPHDDK